MKEIFRAEYIAPFGELVLLFDAQDNLYSLSFHKDRDDKCLIKLKANLGEIKIIDAEVSKPLKAALDAYFSGERSAFDSVKLAPFGTPFQISAWRALQTIPYGKTASYGDQAKKIGNPKAVRAVGGANNKNPIAIVIPCHRVIGSDGKMVGFGGGISTKEWLLQHEAKFAL